MLKMSTGRRASILAVFTIFCVNLLTKSDKRFIISLQVNISIFRNTASHFFVRSTEEWGENPRRRNGTVRCMFFPMGADAPVTRVKPGKALRKERAKAHVPSQDIRFQSPLLAFPKEQYAVHKNVCTKVWKKLWCFFIAETGGSGTAPILYYVKNDKP